MRPIVQKDCSGCGIACVAMLTGESYSTMRRQMFPEGNVTYTYVNDLRKALAKYDVGLAHRSFPFSTSRRWNHPKGFESFLEQEMYFTSDAILAINPSQNGSTWHWVVWDARRRRILDPQEPPYKRIRPLSYLRVKCAR